MSLSAVIGLVAQTSDVLVGRLGEIAGELETLRDGSTSSPKAAKLLTHALQDVQQAIGLAQEADDQAINGVEPAVAYTTTEAHDHGAAAEAGVQAAAAPQAVDAAAAAAAAPTIYSSVIAPELLGTCTAAVHDRYVIDGGDGFLYRTYHPRVVPVAANGAGATCTFAHEHGDDPSKQTLAKIRNIPVMFGYIGRRAPSATEPLGHDEPHEGFKIYVANKGQRNNEGRTNLHDSRIMVHMGSGGAMRFNMRFHSVQVVVQTSYAWLNVQTMADSGGVGNICASPRQGKTVMTLATNCKVDSLYEIWEMNSPIVNSAGRLVARATISSALFDPITVFDPKSTMRLVYIWDPAVNATLNFPNTSRTSARGCKREAYHGPTLWDNGSGKEVYYTDPYGKEIANGPLKQEVSRYRATSNFVATNDGLSQFKQVSNNCGAGLGYKN